MPYPIESFFDVKEHRSCSLFVVSAYAEVVDQVCQLEGGGVLFPEGELLVSYFISDFSLDF